MRRTIGVLWAAAVLLAFCAPLIAEPPDIVTLAKPKVFGFLSREPVRFPHGRHLEVKDVDCLTCHHDYKDGKNILDLATLWSDTAGVRCETCHETAVSLQKAFHYLCITCHDTEKKQGRQTGPRTCGECHAPHGR